MDRSVGADWFDRKGVHVLDWRAAQAAIDLVRGSRTRAGIWTLPILAALEAEPLRHNDLLRAVGSGISARVLEETLQRLRHDGLVTRAVEHGSPVTVWYDLTDLARSFLDALGTLATWARHHDTDLVNQRDLPERGYGAGHSAHLATGT